MIDTSLLCCLAAIWLDPERVGQRELVVDMVDPSDQITLPPAGVVSIDLAMTGLVNGDRWSAAGIRGVTVAGTRLIYAPNDDPNTPGEFSIIARPAPSSGSRLSSAPRAVAIQILATTG